MHDIQDLDYAFDALGNLDQRKDYNQAQTTYEDFAYDDLNRLTDVELVVGTTSQGTQTFDHDALGNLTSKTGVGAYNYTTSHSQLSCPAEAEPSGPHAVRRIGSRDFCYDANGNQLRGWNFTAGRERELSWTAYQ